MIHPDPDQQHVQQRQPPVVYELVATEKLPAFNPEVTVKHIVLTKRHARTFNCAIARIRPMLIPSLMCGYVMRIAATFSPAEVGRVLAPISPLMQLPVVLLVKLGFRYELVKVLARSFEFGFVVLSSTIWIVCFGFLYRDTRAAMLPLCWSEFVDLLLVETYFRDGGNVVFIMFLAGSYLLALMTSVSIDGIDQAHHQDYFTGAVHSFTSKDMIVNTMGTILALMTRLVYRKAGILRNQRRCQASTWTQSIGYRCRIALQPRAQVHSPMPTQVAVAAATISTPLIAQGAVAPSPDPVTAFAPSPSVKNLERACPEPVSTESGSLLQMRFVQDSRTFDPAQSLLPQFRLHNSLARWQVQLLYSGGTVGFALSVFAIHPGSAAHPEALRLSAVLALALSTAFVCPFTVCSQRQLLYKLCKSFDFVFLYAQQLTAHVCLCDVLAWRWTHCCAVAASFVWTHWVLTLDTIPPVLRDRLGFKTEFAIPVLVTRMTMQLFFLCELLLWNQYTLQNRLLLDSVWFGHRVQFYVVPFLLSRMITVFIWCVRLVYRILTRKSPNELIIMLGNVEYDYVQWKQRHQRQQQGRRAQEIPLAEPGAGESAPPTHTARHTNSVVLFEPVLMPM